MTPKPNDRFQEAIAMILSSEIGWKADIRDARLNNQIWGAKLTLAQMSTSLSHSAAPA